MKKLIPFEKELLFKTKVCEITSISLEHTFKMEEEDLISGKFIISGDYKMTEGSINREKFDYEIPFDIALDSRYDTNNMVVDIEDFHYNIVNSDILKIKIVLYIEGDLVKSEPVVIKEENAEMIPFKEEKEKVIPVEKVEVTEEDIEIIPNVVFNKEKEDTLEVRNVKEDKINSVKESVRNMNDDNDIEITIENTNINTNQNANTYELKGGLFDHLDNTETYATYHVYIVKDDDNIDKILQKYNVSKDDISAYNDITEIKTGDKIIIPTPFNG